MISILCPTRARPELYKRSIVSLLDNADNPANVQILARLDEDDDYHAYEGLPGMLLVDLPYGYEGQHRYNNQLAEHATGDWLMIWNDDALCKTQSWDSIIESHAGRFELLSLDNNQPKAYGCFPVVPRKWFEACGHLSLDCRVDTWLNEVAKGAGCFVDEPRVYIFHDRADLTGNNDDEVYKTRYLHADFYTSFDKPEMQAARQADVEVIRALL